MSKYILSKEEKDKAYKFKQEMKVSKIGMHSKGFNGLESHQKDAVHEYLESLKENK